VRGISLDPEDIQASAEGYHELRDRIPVLTRIHVHYRLRIPPGSRDTVDRALARHLEKCPTANTLKGAVEMTWEADIEEQDGE
jgi:uncharacterized OsmC-like protein